MLHAQSALLPTSRYGDVTVVSVHLCTLAATVSTLP
jgi:hypothetical protein